MFIILVVIIQLHNYNTINNWRASEAGETLSGVTQLKIGDNCLFMYMCGRTDIILYFDPHIFVLAL